MATAGDGIAMTPNTLRTFAILVVALGTLMSACTGNEPPAPLEPTMETIVVGGVIELPEGSDVDLAGLEVVSFAETKAVNPGGSFELLTNEATMLQMLFVTKRGEDVPMLIALYDPHTGEVRADVESTAVAMTLANPALAVANAIEQRRYLELVRAHEDFPLLVTLLQDALVRAPSSLLDADANAAFYARLGTIMVAATEAWLAESPEALAVTALAGAHRFPYIEDRFGKGIDIVNPRYIVYGAGITRTGERQSLGVWTVNRRVSWLVGDTSPGRTAVELEDGAYRINLHKGGDFSKLVAMQWNDPSGRATIVNTGHIIVEIAKLTAGHVPVPDFMGLPYYLQLSVGDVYDLTTMVDQGDTFGLILKFFEIVGENHEALAYWLWQDQKENLGSYLRIGGNVLKRAFAVLQILDFGNGTGHFVWDLAFAPRATTVYATIRDGALVSTSRNDPPTARFVVTPPAGTVATTFTFDASASTDDLDPLTALRFRWDFDGDGTYDTAWLTEPVTTHSYDANAPYTVVLEVKDSEGLVGSAKTVVSVGGGAGDATNVIVFRDVEPWRSNATIAVLELLGFQEGESGRDTYRVLPSADMATASMVPGRDLVIISNDQPQNFYDAYAAVQYRFDSFAFSGGALLWGACDRGWASGSMGQAGVVLPANVRLTSEYDHWNFVPNPGLPLVVGLPESMSHYYASHGSFDWLPTGSVVYTVDSEARPTLVEYNHGAGWVMLTAQPLEFQFDRPSGDAGMHDLLPRIVAHFTGREVPVVGAVVAPAHGPDGWNSGSRD